MIFILANLKKLRMQAGISQQQLGEIVGVSQQSINKYENHNIEPDIATLCALADYFQTSVDDLIGRTQAVGSEEHRGLNREEIKLIEQFRTLNAKQKSCVCLLLDTYRSVP